MATMEEILSKLLVADNTIIQQGTNELRQALKNPESVGMLCQVITSSPNPQIRQYAAVILRRRIAKRPKHWCKFPGNIRTEVKSVLFQTLVTEPEKIVKSAVAQLIAIIMRLDLTENNSWVQLYQFLNQFFNSSNPDDKELATFILSTVTEECPEAYQTGHAELMSLLAQMLGALQDLGCVTAFYIMRTLMHMAPFIERYKTMVDAYNTMLPTTMTAVQALSRVNHEKAAEALELYYELCDCAVSVLSPHVKNLLTLCLTLARDKSLSDELRVKAISLVGCLVRTKTRAIVKHKMVEPIVDVLFELMSTAPDSESHESYSTGDTDDITPVTCATQTLDLLAIHLKPDKLIPHMLQHIEPGLRSNDVCAKKASYLAMAVLAEGCSEYIRSKYLQDFLRCICQGITDPSPLVRNAALFALGQFSEYLQPEISEYAQQLLPVLFDYLGQMCAHLKQEKQEPPSIDRMFYALETFCENLNDGLNPYLPILMSRMLETLSMDCPVHVKELAISAIGAAANASKENMAPYFGQVIATLDGYLNATTTDETMCLKVQSVDTLGVLARTVGIEQFAPLIGKSLDLGIKLIVENDEPDLRKAVYGLFASLASLTKAEMAPVLPKILEHIFASIQSSDGVVSHYKDDEISALPIEKDLSDEEENEEEEEDIEISDEDDADDDDAFLSGYTVSNSYIEEKEEAILALREIALHTGEAFLPYLEKSFEETFKMVNYPQEDVKDAAIDALTQFCINFSKIMTPEGRDALLKALGVFVPKLSELIRLDSQVTVAVGGLEALAELLKEIKSDVVAGEGHKEAIMNCVTDVFSGQVECQDQDDAEGDDVEAEQDEYLVECAGEVLSSFGKVIPEQEFARYFETVMSYLMERLKENKSVAQRSFAIGTISECLSGLKYMTGRLAQQFFALFKKHIKDSSPEVRNNAYYGLGELIVWGKDAMFQHYTEILNLLSQALGHEQHPGPRDNMVGVIARLITTNYSLIDLERVLPGFVQQLPLKQDFDEYQAVFRSILTLYKNGHQAIKPHIQPLLKVAISVLHEKQVPNEETKHLISEFINSTQQDFLDDWNTVFAELPPEIQQILSS